MVALLLLVAMQDAPACEAPRAEDVVGIWQMSFHPRHEDLYERDAGYLVFLPDGTYWRWDNDYLVEPTADTAATEHGRWSLAPTGTLLRPGASKAPEGRSIEDSVSPAEPFPGATPDRSS